MVVDDARVSGLRKRSARTSSEWETWKTRENSDRCALFSKMEQYSICEIGKFCQAFV